VALHQGKTDTEVPRGTKSYLHYEEGSHGRVPHGCELWAHILYACEVHACEMHAHGMHVYEVHTHEMRAYKVHAHEVRL
jgi:hypothetical protein